MILFVLSMHAAVTYSGRGGWYYTEPSDLSRTTLILFTFYQSYLQSFFMGLLFFLAGYFVPKAYDTKGTSKFLKDRAVRLGVPTLLYIFIIGPLTEYYVSFSWHPDPIDRSFLQEYTNYILRFRFPGGTGPLWFCATLLIFCAGYALLKSFSPKKEALPEADDPPDTRTVFAFIVLVSVTTFLFRVPWPKGTSFYNMQLCYFAQYILFFMAGTRAYRENWLAKISKMSGRYWGMVAFISGLLWLPLVIAGGALKGQIDLFMGGFYWQSFGLSVWESMVGVSVSIFLIVLFREKFNHQGVLARFLSINAFAVYVFHPPILIAIARMMGSLQVHPLIKFPLLTSLSIVASFTLCEFVFRKIPVLKTIL